MLLGALNLVGLGGAGLGTGTGVGMQVQGNAPNLQATGTLTKMSTDPATLHQAFHYADIAVAWRQSC